MAADKIACLAVQQQELAGSVANGYVTIFLADQQAAMQIVQSDYAMKTAGSIPFGGGIPFVSNLPSANATNTTNTRRRLAQATVDIDYAAIPPPSQSTIPYDYYYPNVTSLPPVVVALNQAVSVPIGSRVTLRLNLQDNVGEVFLFAFFDP